MAAPSDAEFVLRVLLATGCGAAIGLERQYRSRTAGLRTFALVAAGAAAFVLFGEQAGVPAAPLQITAYVVSGIGFLGGGVILRQGFSVQGLNTAATLWCSAAVGCQAAGGHVIPALALTVIVLTIHAVLRPFGRLLDKLPAVTTESVAAYVVRVEVGRKHEPQLRAQILHGLAKPEVTVRGLAGRTIEDGSDGDAAMVQLQARIEVEGTPDSLLDGLVNRLSVEPGVRSISWYAEDSEDSDDELDDRLFGWRRLPWRRATRRDD
jgi:putative Mg2+ transporter-C (MgtC) family protein